MDYEKQATFIFATKVLRTWRDMVYGVSMETMHEEFMKQVLEYHDYCQTDIYSPYAGLPTKSYPT